MQPDQFLLPAIATVALGTALLVPLRDDRPGKRATVWRPGVTPIPTVVEPHGDGPAAQPARHRSTLRALMRWMRTFFEAPQPEALPLVDAATDVHEVVERSFAEELDALMPLVHGPKAADDGPEPEDPTPIPPHCEMDAPAHGTFHQHVPAVHLRFDRIVPITRLPLRPRALAITWTQLAPAGVPLATQSERHAYLTELANERDASLEPLLIAAYREEDDRGRVLALKGIRNIGGPETAGILRDALGVGTDDERSFAVDALLAMDRSDAVTPAFSDRVDAIAAQAALGFVWSHRRADFYTALEPYVDRPRIDAILSLLAGIVE